jgi:DNA modification methylase
MATVATPRSNTTHAFLHDLLITEILISELLPLNRRARTHRRKQIEQIAGSIRTFGFINPVLVDECNRVIAGFGRVLAAEFLGMDRVPTICIAGMSVEQVRAYAIADNKIAENAGWDREVLALEFQYLEALDIDLDLTVTGFETPEIDLVIGEATLEKPEPPIPPVKQDVIVTRPGDLWLMGQNRLLCADACDASSYLALLEGSWANAIITDPPFNLRVAGLVGKGRIKHPEFAMASGELSENEFAEFLRRFIRCVVAHSEDGSLHYIFMDWRHVGVLTAVAAELYSEQKALIVWDKGRGGMGSLYRSGHELVLVFKQGTAPHTNNIQLGKFGRDRTNVWRYPPARPGGEADLNLHPTSKPISMIADAIQDCTHRGDIVLDPFGGSGTTLLAAEKTGRNGYLIELEPKYVDLTVRRWQGLTGGRAVNGETGQTFDEQWRERNLDPSKTEVSHVR